MVDWLDVGFNIVIGFAFAGVVGYSIWSAYRKIKKEREDDDGLPRL